MGELADHFRDIKRQVEFISVEASKDIVMAMVTHGVYNAPADTSKLISNFVVNFNTPPSDASDIAAHIVGKGGTTRNGSAIETINRAQFALTLKKQGDITYLSNVTPYIGYVNDGTDTIPAANFIEAMVLVGKNFELSAEFAPDISF